ARGGAAECLIRAGSFAHIAEQERNWAILWPSPEQEPPKSLLLGIGVMTLGSSSFVEDDF
ncbi:hypothetical protein A2U01_0066082, partial [Trifolium medium]|nr:hypothetical protein [Trifolium medium]